MSDYELLSKFGSWVKDKGVPVALSELTKRGVSAHTADLLVKGHYNSSPRSLLRMTLVELLKAESRAS